MQELEGRDCTIRDLQSNLDRCKTAEEILEAQLANTTVQLDESQRQLNETLIALAIQAEKQVLEGEKQKKCFFGLF